MPTANVQLPRPGFLSCLTERDEETNVYISYCLDLDLMECGRSANEAWDNLKLAVKHYMEHCYARYPEGLSKSASPEEWKHFAEVLRSCGTVSRVEEVEINRPAVAQREYPVWMQGVDTDGTDCSNLQ